MTISRTICLGFLAAIALGTGLFMLPISTADGSWGDFFVALFTATSAVCVTGLSVVDCSTYFSFWGQLTLLLLLQAGGLGYMTITTFLMLLIGRKFDLQQRFAIQESFDRPFIQGSRNLIKSVIATTLVFESLGSLLLFQRFSQDFPPLKALWYSIFHSVSAFNNAGFSLFPDSLVQYHSSVSVNLAITLLIILGGIGYQVIIESYLWLLSLVRRYKRPYQFSLNYRVVTRVSLFLLFVGMAAFVFLEYRDPDTMLNLPPHERLLVAWFQSVTTRTAGFNTVDLSLLNPTTLVVIMLLMFIGASPSGTGGGIKTTTIAILANCTRSALRGQERVIIFGRRIPYQLILKAVAVVFGSVAMVIFSTGALIFMESEQNTVALTFEALSAFATVGLSLGITPELSTFSQLVLIFTMYVGRLGVTLFMAAIVGDSRPSLIRYPEENLLIG